MRKDNLNKLKKLEFEVSLIPPSVNLMYRRGRGQTIYKTNNAKSFEYNFNHKLGKLFKKYDKYIIQKNKYELCSGLPEIPYQLLIIIYFPSLRFKNGKWRKIDASNHIKAVEDAIEDFSKVNDKFNFDVRILKRECGHNPRICCKLKPLSKKMFEKIICNCDKKGKN